MFDAFYGLSGPPFLLTPDPRFFFGSSGHSRAMSHLVYGLSQQEGFIVITGEVGAGKTTLVEQIWSQLDRRTYIVARIVTTQVSADDLLRLVMMHFGLEDVATAEKSVMLRRFELMVREIRGNGKRCLLVVDEAQNLSLAAMEELRMLSNITVDGRASVQTLLLGQPQFRATLASPYWEQLRQRVLASYHLGPLTPEEVRGYIEHRLRTVGWRERPSWDEDAFSAIYQGTNGIPRRINTLCSRVLLLGALEQVDRITAAMIQTTAAELSRDLGDAPSSAADVALHGGLEERLDTLEQIVSRQEEMFRRMLTLLERQAAGLA